MNMSHQGAAPHDHNGQEHHHGHDHDGHDHSDEVEPALQTLIWNQIEFEKIRTLNESEIDAGAKIVEKTWPQRLDPEPELVSDSDGQLLMFVPYVSLHICPASPRKPLSSEPFPSQLTFPKLRRRPKTPLPPPPHLRLRLGAQNPASLPQQRRP